MISVRNIFKDFGKLRILNGISCEIKKGECVVIIGPSGSGKSTLVNSILGRTLMNKIYKSKEKPGEYKTITGLDYVDKIVNITQDPIGRTPRSNPATYTNVFSDIRKLFENTPDAKNRYA